MGCGRRSWDNGFDARPAIWPRAFVCALRAQQHGRARNAAPRLRRVYGTGPGKDLLHGGHRRSLPTNVGWDGGPTILCPAATSAAPFAEKRGDSCTTVLARRVARTPQPPMAQYGACDDPGDGIDSKKSRRVFAHFGRQDPGRSGRRPLGIRPRDAYARRAIQGAVTL